MESRGRKKKTDAERKAAASRQKDVVNGGKGAKIVTLGKLTRKPPEGLSTPENAVWRDFIEECQGNRAVRVPDKAEIVHYCKLTVRAERLRKRVESEGEILEKTNTKGDRIPFENPALGSLRKDEKELRSIRRDFGMSPIGRKKIDLEISEIEYAKEAVDNVSSSTDYVDEFGLSEQDYEAMMDGHPGED